jgi:hypothetical protein
VNGRKLSTEQAAVQQAGITRRWVGKRISWCVELLRGRPMLVRGHVVTRKRLAAFVLIMASSMYALFQIGTHLAWQVAFAGSDTELCDANKTLSVLNAPNSSAYRSFLDSGVTPNCGQYVNVHWWQYLPYNHDSAMGSYAGGLALICVGYLVYMGIMSWLLDRDEMPWELAFPTRYQWYRKYGGWPS